MKKILFFKLKQNNPKIYFLLCFFIWRFVGAQSNFPLMTTALTPIKSRFLPPLTCT